MIRRIGLAACALVLLAVTGATAQVVTGTVVRIDPPAQVVFLDNGQMYRATSQTVFLVNNQPTNFAAIQPGMPIVVQQAQPVMYRDGQYVVVSQPAPAAVAAVPSSATYEVSGVVRYVHSPEPGRSSLIFENGRQVWIDENTQVYVNGAPALLTTLRPGTFVVVRSSKPFAFRNNTYYVAMPATTAPGAVVTTPGTAIAAPPAIAPTPVVMPPVPNVVTGTVARLNQPNIIVLSDGRMIPATSQTVVMVGNRAVPLTTLQPGTRVVIYPNGQAAVASDPSAFPAAAYPPAYPEMGTRENQAERNSP